MKEIWIIRHSHRRDYEPGWDKHPRYKENRFDSPLSKYGFELAKKGASELIKKSKELQNKNIKYIYCSPYTRCIQSAIELIKEVKNKLNFDIKLIIVYNLGESGWWARYNDFKFNGDDLIINKVLIDSKMKPDGLKKRFKQYITKIIGKTIKDVTYDNEIKTMTNAILNINNKQKDSYIIIGHLDTIRLGYKYFNQDKIIKKEPDWAKGGHEYVNIIMGFSENNKKFKMIYKPNNKF